MPVWSEQLLLSLFFLVDQVKILTEETSTIGEEMTETAREGVIGTVTEVVTMIEKETATEIVTEIETIIVITGIVKGTATVIVTVTETVIVTATGIVIGIMTGTGTVTEIVIGIVTVAVAMMRGVAEDALPVRIQTEKRERGVLQERKVKCAILSSPFQLPSLQFQISNCLHKVKRNCLLKPVCHEHFFTATHQSHMTASTTRTALCYQWCTPLTTLLKGDK